MINKMARGLVIRVGVAFTGVRTPSGLIERRWPPCRLLSTRQSQAEAEQVPYLWTRSGPECCSRCGDHPLLADTHSLTSCLKDVAEITIYIYNQKEVTLFLNLVGIRDFL